MKVEERFFPQRARKEAEVFASLRMTGITQPRMAVPPSRSEDRPLHRQEKPRIGKPQGSQKALGLFLGGVELGFEVLDAFQQIG